jgi:outer membrane protein OmpA-like peptidoglycan-associated protein
MMTTLTSLSLGAAALVLGTTTAHAEESTAPTAELFFGFDSARLGEDTSARLAPVIAYAKANPRVKIVLDGHADPIGASTYNVKLSLRRAEVVRDRLVMAGLDGNQIVIGVYGEDGLRRSEHAADRRVSLWTTEQPMYSIIDHTFQRGTAVVWTKPVPQTALR